MKPSRAAQRRYIDPFQVPLLAAAPTETGRPLMVDERKYMLYNCALACILLTSAAIVIQACRSYPNARR
jgi:hypothetical protein